MTDYLHDAYPGLGSRLCRTSLADLPTPVLSTRIAGVDVWVKRDDLSASLYGGNKIRKLEYLFHKAAERRATRVATFGAVASNHALATAIYARELGLHCTCFLSHQPKSKKAATVLRAHSGLDTELVYYGGGYRQRVHTLRRHLKGRKCWIIPMGGSSWLGSVGFVNAAFELADQVSQGELPCPDAIYVATGTMGTTAGLALGLALAGLPSRVHAVRVTDRKFASPDGLRRLLCKIATMLSRNGADIPGDILTRIHVEFRDEFFAGGYAKFDDATTAAVQAADRDAGLRLETTYTGKAMAALLHDAAQRSLDGNNIVFWDTYNSRPLPETPADPALAERLPDAFVGYVDD